MGMLGRTTTAAATAAVVLLLAGCGTDGGPAPTTTSAPPTGSPPATSTTEPAPTPPGPDATPAPLTLYLVRVGDDGASGEPIGCGDSLVAVPTEPITTDDPLRASITRLLQTPEGETVDTGLYTAVPGGSLDYVDGRLEADGTVTVELTGRPLLRGVCDDPRLEAQLERTAMTATGASEARILIDGVPLEEYLRLD